MRLSARPAQALIAVVALTIVAFPRTPHAQSAVIKLATVVPENSIWDKNLKQMAEDWKQATGDRVSLTVFAAARRATSRPCFARCAWTRFKARPSPASGSRSIDPAFNVFNVPFFFESYDELNAVIAKLTPVLQKRADAKGFVLVHWGHGGWLQVFTKRPVQTVQDLKGIKLYTSAGDDRMTQWYKANGFQPRAMAMTDILTGLTTGMIEGLPTPPLARDGVPVVPADAVHARYRPGARRRRDGHCEENLDRDFGSRPRKDDSRSRRPWRSGCRATCRSRMRSPSS